MSKCREENRVLEGRRGSPLFTLLLMFANLGKKWQLIRHASIIYNAFKIYPSDSFKISVCNMGPKAGKKTKCLRAPLVAPFHHVVYVCVFEQEVTH